MSAIVVVVGIDKWKRTTQKFYESFRMVEPDLPLVIVDNVAVDRYPDDLDPWTKTVHLRERVGYGQALNAGILVAGKYDWYCCFNNDNIFEGPISPDIKRLKANTLYGSKWKYDDLNYLWLMESAWLLVPFDLIRAIGLFDPKCDAAYEDADYEVRAMKADFTLRVADLLVQHTDKHTRYASGDYMRRWHESFRYYHDKHKLLGRTPEGTVYDARVD